MFSFLDIISWVEYRIKAELRVGVIIVVKINIYRGGEMMRVERKRGRELEVYLDRRKDEKKNKSKIEEEDRIIARLRGRGR